MAKEKKPYIYKGYEFTDNGHGDYYNAEVDKFLIFRPGPMMVDTVMHKDGSVTMNQEKFKENTDKNKGVYEEGYELNDDGSVFVKEEDVDEKIEEESKDNKSTSGPVEESKDNNLEDSGLDNYDKEKLEGLIGYGIPQDVSDDFTDITGEESQAIEDAIAEIDDSLTGYEELNDFEDEYGAIRDYDRLDNLESDLSEYLGNKIDEGEIDESFRNEVENIIGSAEDTANETLDYDIQAYLDSHKFEETYEENEFDQEAFEDSLERKERASQMYLDGDMDYDDLVESYFEGNKEDADEYINNLKGEESHEKREYRFDFGFKDGASLRSDAFDDAKAYLEEEDMAQYLDEPLKSKIDSMKWVLDDESSVHVEVKSNQPLTDEDMKKLKSFIEGQNSDGLGEGFEQQKFAEGYYDPETGDGPYSYREMMDIVTENYDNMDFDEYRDYIEYDDLREGLENYLKDGNYNVSFEDYLVENADWKEEGYNSEEEFREHLEQTPEEQLFEEYNDTYDAWLESEEDDFVNSGYVEDYISEDAIYNAKDQLAKNDSRYNENLWDGGMTSMEWDIPDGVDVTPKSETVTEDVSKLSNDNFWENDVQPGDKLNSSGAGEIEILDLDKNSDYILLKRNSDYEPYVAAWAPDSRDGKLSWNQGHYFESEEDARKYFNEKANRNYSDDELLDKVDRHYTPQIDNDTVSTIASAFNDINDSHAFGVNKAVDKLLEYGEVVKVNAGKNGSNQVEVEVNNGKGKIIFDRDGGRLIGEFPYTQLLTYAGAIEEYKKYKDSDVSFNFDRNRFETNLPKNGDRLVPIDPNTPQEEAERITNNKKIMIEKQTDSAFSIPGKEWEVLEEGNSAFGNKLYKVKDSQGNVQWKDADDLEERTTKIEPRFTRIYDNRDEAYKGYMNGEITFEEYEEYIKKLARR